MKLSGLLGTLARVLQSSSKPTTTTAVRPAPRPGPRPEAQAAQRDQAPVLGITEYDVRRLGAPTLTYEPNVDGDADPGEVVWGWVPYEEDASQGKDRPILVVGYADAAGRAGSAGGGGGAHRPLVGLQLTSHDRADDGIVRMRDGRVWMDIGTGDWDSKRRPSEVRLDRPLLVDPTAVRREGGVLGRDRFETVTAELRHQHGW